MTEEQVERVAKALVDAEKPLCYDTTWAGVCEAPSVKAAYLAKARAAIAAMQSADPGIPIYASRDATDEVLRDHQTKE